MRLWALTCALCWPTAALAEINVGETVDQMWWDSDVVVVAQVGPQGVKSLVPERMLKGSLPPGGQRVQIGRRCDTPGVRPGERAVFFLTWRDDVLSARCQSYASRHWLVSLDSPEHAFTPGGRLLNDGDTLLAYLTQVEGLVAALPPDTPRGLEGMAAFQVEPAFDTEASAELFSGSAVYLFVPPYVHYLPAVMARAHHEQPYQRREAAQQLAAFGGPQVEPMLRRLAQDPHMDENGRYPVREAAKMSLMQRGVRPDGLDLRVGFVEAPEGSTVRLGGKDSAAGSITLPDGEIIHFDIGKMAGTHVHARLAESCSDFSEQTRGPRTVRTCQDDAGFMDLTWTARGTSWAYPANFGGNAGSPEKLKALQELVHSYTPRDSHLRMTLSVPRGLEVRTTGRVARSAFAMESNPLPVAVSIDRQLGHRIRWKTESGWTEPEHRCGVDFMRAVGPQVGPEDAPSIAELVLFETSAACAASWDPSEGYAELHRVYLGDVTPQ